jgi:MinD-like ATPase involved in chromosome partitioning or flagellar assembly
MTDNSDFMARYLRPDTADRREQPTPPSADDDAKVEDPQMPQPAPPRHPRVQLPSSGFDAAPPPPPRAQGGGEATHARPAPPPAAGTGHQQPAAGPPGAGQWSAPGRQDADTAKFQQPPPIPPKPRFEDRNQTSVPPERWAPRVDPAERWAPRADPRAGAVDVDRHIQVDEVVKKRREPAEIGWRKAVYVSTGHAVNLGAGPAERQLRDWKTCITANIPGNYQIAAVSVKGGVGKTRVTAGVGSVFAEQRKQPVIAIDANPTYGGLGRLIDPKTLTSVREFLAAEDVVDYPKARFYTGQNKQGLEVLAGNQNVANPMALEATTFTATVSRTRRFYQLALVDCGAEIEHPVVPAVLSASDALMIVGSCSVEGGLAVETTIDWLAARNGHELLKRSVVVLNDAYRCVSKNFVTHVTETLGKRVHSVKTVPWDVHLRDAATLDFPALHRRTQLAFVELAAELAGGFPSAGAMVR